MTTFNYAVALGTGTVIDCRKQAEKYGMSLEEYCEKFPFSCSTRVDDEEEAYRISECIKQDNERISLWAAEKD